MKTEFINLLPVSFRRRQMAQSRTRQWICLWSIGMLLMSGYAWTQVQTYNSSRHELAMRREQFRPIEKMERDADDLQNQIDDLKKRELLALKIANDRPLVQLVGLVSQTAKKSGGIVVHKFEISTAQSDSDPQRRTLTMEGLGMDGASVTRFLKGLRDSKMFVRVDLNSTENSAKNERLRKYLFEGGF